MTGTLLQAGAHILLFALIGLCVVVPESLRVKIKLRFAASKFGIGAFSL